jgi:hypothetical protein
MMVKTVHWNNVLLMFRTFAKKSQSVTAVRMSPYNVAVSSYATDMAATYLYTVSVCDSS